MNNIKKSLSLLIVTVAVTVLAACGSSDEGRKSSETQQTSAQTEIQTTTDVQEQSETVSEETTAAPETTTVPETTTEETEAPGPFTDPAAFAGFDNFSYGSLQGTLGVTTFKELGFDSISRTVQYADDTHQSAKDPETLEPGAEGKIETNYLTKSGAPFTCRVFNPSDAPAAFEDCVVIGFENPEGLTYSNGIDYWSKVEDVIAILGEPNEINGNVGETITQATYYWRDETSDHLFAMSVYIEGEIYDINGTAYFNFSLLNN